ncbi:SOS response-associated peptidase [Candidatus Saccharibacteria bacterium]|nr:SOS response-associated peptidase [Candidatus Saccharibacteria bacterium]
MRFIDDACGRYILKANRKELETHYNLANAPKDLRPNYNVAPGQILPVVTAGEDGMKMELMKWGIVAPWKQSMLLINTRDDKVFSSPLWKGLVSRKRALIPANGFYEWKKPEHAKDVKQPFYIHPKQTDLFSFAGIWNSWKDVEGMEFKTYSIITTSPNKEMSGIHNRMPVILHPDEEASWLDPAKTSREEVEPFLHPYQDNGLDMFEVSTEVNVVRNNDAKLILPINSA